MPFNAFANRADPDQAALVSLQELPVSLQELPDQGLLCLLMEICISDPTQLDLTNNFFVLQKNFNGSNADGSFTLPG